MWTSLQKIESFQLREQGWNSRNEKKKKTRPNNNQPLNMDIWHDSKTKKEPYGDHIRGRFNLKDDHCNNLLLDAETEAQEKRVVDQVNDRAGVECCISTSFLKFFKDVSMLADVTSSPFLPSSPASSGPILDLGRGESG